MDEKILRKMMFGLMRALRNATHETVGPGTALEQKMVWKEGEIVHRASIRLGGSDSLTVHHETFENTFIVDSGNITQESISSDPENFRKEYLTTKEPTE